MARAFKRQRLSGRMNGCLYSKFLMRKFAKIRPISDVKLPKPRWEFSLLEIVCATAWKQTLSLNSWVKGALKRQLVQPSSP